MTTIITVASGFGVSSRFVLTRTGQPLVMTVPSHAARGWMLAFAPDSSSTVFSIPCRMDGTGAPYAVCSGVGQPIVGFLNTPPTLWARVELRGAAFAVDSVLATTSVSIVPFTPS